MHADAEACARAVAGRDPRFDGWFFSAVTSTGIYCRPSCPAMTPRREHLRFYPSAAAAQGAGYRACKRCRPDASPGSPEWSVREDVAARAMRLIADGVLDTDGVNGLAARLGYSTRQLERVLRAEVGAGPVALARAQRAQTARLLIETTSLPMAQVAFAAGFSSIRSFNDTVRAVFATTPSHLRRGSGVNGGSPGGGVELTLRLPYRGPLHVPSLFGHLAATAVPGVERWHEGGFERTVRLPHGCGLVRLSPGEGAVQARLTLTDLRDLTPAIQRCRRLLDLDADPEAVQQVLGSDVALGPVLAQRPGLRIPGTVDPVEMALRVVIGQQVSTAGAATTTGRLVAQIGDRLPPELVQDGGLTHLFPRASQVAELAQESQERPGMPTRRRATLIRLARLVVDDELDLSPGTDRERAISRLSAVPGIGPWTREMIAMRALADPDAFAAADLGVLTAAAQLGLPAQARALEARSTHWRPWRSYAVQALWASSTHAAARLPDDPVSAPAPTPASAPPTAPQECS